MDWLYILMPIAGVKIFWPGLIILGIGVGVIGGFFGMGGAWMVTPGLNILGFPMAFAIGTDIAHMALGCDLKGPSLTSASARQSGSWRVVSSHRVVAAKILRSLRFQNHWTW